MDLSLRGLMEIISHEAIVPMPYRDSKGIWTFGIGHTNAAGAPNPTTLPRGVEQPLTLVFDTFRDDLARFVADVNRAVRVPLAQHEFDALVSFHFNTGAIGRATLVERLNAGDRAAAIAGFDAWHKPKEIIGRRDKEKALFQYGTYSGGGFANVYPATEAGTVQWHKGRRVRLADILGAVAEPVPARHDSLAFNQAPAVELPPAPAVVAGPHPRPSVLPAAPRNWVGAAGIALVVIVAIAAIAVAVLKVVR